MSEEKKHPVTHPETKFSLGQEVKTKNGLHGKVIDIKNGIYTIAHGTTSDISEDELENAHVDAA